MTLSEPRSRHARVILTGQRDYEEMRTREGRLRGVATFCPGLSAPQSLMSYLFHWQTKKLGDKIPSAVIFFNFFLPTHVSADTRLYKGLR